MKKYTMQETAALSLQSKQDTLSRNYQEAINPTKTDPKTGATVKPSSRKAFVILLEQIAVESQLQSIYDSTVKTPLEVVGTSIAIHSLKVLARGRQYIDKDGKTAFTPINIEAKKLLEKGRNDDSGILQDLIQAVTLAVWEAIASGTITIVDTITENGSTFPRLTLTDTTDDTTMRKILNVVQHEFYQNQQKHFAHEYRTIMDDDGNESDIMVTQAMREWEKSIQFIGESELLESLQITLTDREKSVLSAKLQQKQVERTYRTNGKTAKRYEARYLTIADIVAEGAVTFTALKTPTEKTPDFSLSTKIEVIDLAELKAFADDNSEKAINIFADQRALTFAEGLNHLVLNYSANGMKIKRFAKKLDAFRIKNTADLLKVEPKQENTVKGIKQALQTVTDKITSGLKISDDDTVALLMNYSKWGKELNGVSMPIEASFRRMLTRVLYKVANGTEFVGE